MLLSVPAGEVGRPEGAGAAARISYREGAKAARLRGSKARRNP